MTGEKCRACPLAGPSRECPAVEFGHRRYCQLVDPGHPDFDEGYVRVLLGDARPVAASAGGPIADESTIRLAMLAETCPFGSGPCGCGDLPRACSRPDRAGPVWRRDCLECVSRPSP